ncbi:MAG TPA: hypothetical protein VH041_15285 [Caldimonas sp.]|jgi:hypothetical protein|nr:hypothetical protein [Caldimonas sp.]HEX4235655.1 hypothetical protein [Caldimonas sp.]
MNPFLASSPLRRVTAWTVTVAMLLPTVVACTTPYPEAATARLDGIVVDGSRLAGAREAGLAVITRNGVREEAYAGTALQTGDRLDTGPRAYAVIRYPSGTELLMRPSSGGTIGSLTDFVGEVFVKVKGIFSVDTTFVKAGARGTAYLVRTYAGGTTAVVVVDGVVDVGSTTGAWPTVPLRAGTMTFAHPRAPQPTAANVDDLARTREWVERVERLAPPPSGVSTSTIVGAALIAAAIAAILAGGGKGSSGDRPPPAATTTPSTTPSTTRTPSPPPAGVPRDPPPPR